jgi:hypothetical protein
MKATSSSPANKIIAIRCSLDDFIFLLLADFALIDGGCVSSEMEI